MPRPGSIPSSVFRSRIRRNSMQILSISWVRNEADIIEDFVRHHTGFLDRMIIMDNASTDATPQILQSLIDEGLPIEIRHSDSTIHNQGEHLTALMHELQSDKNDRWILPLDADEFLLSSIGSVVNALHHLPTDAVVLLPWKTYVPTPMDDESGVSILKRMQHRRSEERPQYRKILIPSKYQGDAYRIPLGSHSLESTLPIPIHLSNDLFLAHFPVRSPEHIQRKVIENWERHLLNPNRKPGQNFHWERLYEEMQKSPPTPERLHHIGLYYASTDTLPMETVFDPCYTDLS
jgi:hypothetical protein